jgi:hypothetical protein
MAQIGPSKLNVAYAERLVALTQGQTVVPVPGGYVPGLLKVFMNGGRLVRGLDYVADDGVNCVLNDAVADSVSAIVFESITGLDKIMGSATDVGALNLATYSGSVSYSQNALARVGRNVYYSLVDNNVGNDPASSPTKWKLWWGSMDDFLSRANVWVGPQAGQFKMLTDAANVAVDLSLGNNFALGIGGNRVLQNPTNVTPGQSGVILVQQDATGNRSLAFGSMWRFTDGTAPTLTSTPIAYDYIAYVVDPAGVSITCAFIRNPKQIGT